MSVMRILLLAIYALGAVPSLAAARPAQASRSETRPVTAVRVIPDLLTVWSGPAIPVAVALVNAGTVLEVLGQEGQFFHIRLPYSSITDGYVLAHLVERVELPAAATSREPDGASSPRPAAAPATTPEPPPSADAAAPIVSASVSIPQLADAPSLSDIVDAKRSGPAFVRDFRQASPGDGTPATLATVAYLWYDEKSLHVVFDCADDTARIRAGMAKRENIADDDYVLVFIDTFRDRRRAYEFAVNPLGIQRDGIRTEGQGTDYTFDTVWESDARLTDRGFVVSITIPFKSLRFATADDQRWAIALGRQVARINERSYWPYITSRISGLVNQMANLDGIRHAPSGHNAQIVPYAAFTGARFLDTDRPAFVVTNEGRAGFDAKAVIGGALTLDATVNPDFSQVESDDPQLVVNRRFEVFFPEKRPFFIENAGLFSTPERLLFSRRVIDPQFGLRLSGKAGRWVIGALAADDRAAGSQRSGDLAGRRAFDAAVRLQREVGQESTIGLLVVSRDFASSFNRVGSIDTRVKAGQNWSFRGQMIGSYDRALDDTLRRGFASNGSAAFGGRHFNYSGSYLDRSPGFKAALGFIPRVDLRATNHSASYYWYPEHGPLMSFGPSAGASMDWDFTGRRQDWEATSGFSLFFKPQFGVSVYRSDIYELFDGVDFQQQSNTVSAYTNQFQALSLSGSYSWGTTPNYSPPEGLTPFLAGTRTASAGLTFRPNRRLRIDEAYFYTRVSTLIDRLPPGSFPATVFTNAFSRTKINFQFTRAASIRAIVDYNTLVPASTLIVADVGKRLTTDWLFTYLVNPFSAVHVGYTERLENLDLDTSARPTLRVLPSASTPTSRQLFVKISYRLGL